jgi:hypothetical protein
LLGQVSMELLDERLVVGAAVREENRGPFLWGGTGNVRARLAHPQQTLAPGPRRLLDAPPLSIPNRSR